MCEQLAATDAGKRLGSILLWATGADELVGSPYMG